MIRSDAKQVLLQITAHLHILNPSWKKRW